MPSMTSRNGSRRSRRMVSDINVVPYIDVMLVLLVIFMVTAPLLPPGQIELPTVGKSNVLAEPYIAIEIDAQQQMTVKLRNSDDPFEAQATRADIFGIISNLRLETPMPVGIAADKAVPYEAVMFVLDGLKRANVDRVGLLGEPEGR